MHDSYLNYSGYRYLKWAVVLVIAAIAVYAMDPEGGGGDTWVGYGLGTLGALLITWLLWFGIRKRRYRSRLGTVRGWLSAHVYLGLALLVIATLHADFEFGMNVHTLAYVLMVLVITTGVWGVVAYSRYPSLMTMNREGIDTSVLLDEVDTLETQALGIADKLGPGMHDAVAQSFARARTADTLWSRLFYKEKKDNSLRESARAVLEESNTEPLDFDFDEVFEGQRQLAHGTVRYMASEMSRSSSGEKVANLRKLVGMIGQRRLLLRRLNQDLRMRAWMQLWLYVHVPLSTALLAALVIHIVVVFYWW